MLFFSLQWGQSNIVFIALKIAFKFIVFKESDESLGFVRKTFVLAFFGLSAAISGLLLLQAIGDGYKESIKSKFSEFNSHIEVYSYNHNIDLVSAHEIIGFLKNKEMLEDFSFLTT